MLHCRTRPSEHQEMLGEDNAAAKPGAAPAVPKSAPLMGLQRPGHVIVQGQAPRIRDGPPVWMPLRPAWPAWAPCVACPTRHATVGKRMC